MVVNESISSIKNLRIDLLFLLSPKGFGHSSSRRPSKIATQNDALVSWQAAEFRPRCCCCKKAAPFVFSSLKKERHPRSMGAAEALVVVAVVDG